MASKVVDIVKSAVSKSKSSKKPFGGHGGRRKKLTQAQQQAKAAEERIAKLERESEYSQG